MEKTKIQNYVVADVCYVVRFTMVASVLNLYRLFSCHYSQNNTVQQLFAKYLHRVRYYKMYIGYMLILQHSTKGLDRASVGFGPGTNPLLDTEG